MHTPTLLLTLSCFLQPSIDVVKTLATPTDASTSELAVQAVTQVVDLYPILMGERSDRDSRSTGECRLVRGNDLPQLDGQHVMSGALQSLVYFKWDKDREKYLVEFYDSERGWWTGGYAFIDCYTNTVVIDGDSGIEFYPDGQGGWKWDAWGPGISVTGTMT